MSRDSCWSALAAVIAVDRRSFPIHFPSHWLDYRLKLEQQIRSLIVLVQFNNCDGTNGYVQSCIIKLMIEG